MGMASRSAGDAAGKNKAAAARRAAKEASRAAELATGADVVSRPPRRGRPSDVFGGELRRRDVFTLLIFHLIGTSESGSSYGNQLIEQIADITGGSITLNPNTVYPLLRTLEGEGMIEGRWEHPEKRSRRLYRITDAGRAEYERLKDALEPFLDSIMRSIGSIKQEIYGKTQ
jgi:PadR family transcriptional regulator PadR